MIMEIEDKNFKITSAQKEQIISYVKDNPCCKFYPKCQHPKHQSDSYLHKSTNIFENSLTRSLLTKNIKAMITHMWAFVTYENEIVNSLWHNHYRDNDNEQLTALMYLTDNNIGTVFEKDYVTKAETNKWYVWDSKLNHKPLETKTNETRIVITTELEVYG
tara:strand:+ start:339 stop:821 length:483 start_codon:yes stop_codon:yes gene_type:complete